MYQFCSGDINKFVLLLREVVYPYEYMASWKRINETSLLDKSVKLDLEDISNKDYAHYQEVLKELGD